MSSLARDLAYLILIALPLGLLLLVNSLEAQGENVTVTFDGPVPPGSSGSLLNGPFEGIDFGSGAWRWERPYRDDSTNHIYFDSEVGISRTFTFSPRPRTLVSMRVFTGVPGTLRLSDNLGQTKSQRIDIGSMQLVTTGWSQASATISVQFSAGWELGVDDITYGTSAPIDTTPPSVSIIAPVNGETVSGAITISAAASDDVGVVGVQFLLDSLNLGAEVRTPPYSISWDTTTTAPDGPHLLTARARDTADNQTTSSPIMVTVSNGLSDAEVLGRWEGPFGWPMAPVHLVLLRTGEVLAWDEARGGLSASLWDPATGDFTSVPIDTNIVCAGHASLPDGRLLVAGGETRIFVGIRDVNIFDPVRKAWAPAAPMAFPRWYPTVTALPDSRVLVVSGSTTCSTCSAETPEIYDPVTNAWIQLTNARLDLPLYPFMFLLPDSMILSAGSVEESIPTRMLGIGPQTWTMVDPRDLDGGSAVMYLPGRVMKAGSPGDPDLPTDDPAVGTTAVLDMAQGSPAWRDTAPMAFSRAYHNLTLLPDGSVLATGGERTTNGRRESHAVYSAELWNPESGTWTVKARMRRPRLYHSTALLLPDGRVLSAGGYFLPHVEENAEIYSPPYLFRGPRPTIVSAPTTVQYGANFLVETPDASSLAMISLVRPGAVTHAFNQDQRFLSLPFQQTSGGVNVQAPANANLAPPGYYMLFIVKTNGVPSLASFVRIP